MALDTVNGGGHEPSLSETLTKIEQEHLQAILDAIKCSEGRKNLYCAEVMNVVEIVEGYGVDVGFFLTRNKFLSDVLFTRDQMDSYLTGCRKRGIQIGGENVKVFCVALQEGLKLSERYKMLFD